MTGAKAGRTARPPGTGLVVMGTSGHAREVLTIANSVDGYRLLGCVGPHRQQEVDRLRVPWLGDDDWLVNAVWEVRYVIGVGSGETRARLDKFVGSSGRKAALLVHPAAVVNEDVQLGDGVVVWPGAVLATGVVAGRHVHLNSNVAVGHDTFLDDFVTLLPGCTIAGSTKIGYAATIGAGATVIDGITIGAGAMIGAGAAVVRDVPEGSVVVGVPAKPLRPPGH